RPRFHDALAEDETELRRRSEERVAHRLAPAVVRPGFTLRDVGVVFDDVAAQRFVGRRCLAPRNANQRGGAQNGDSKLHHASSSISSRAPWRGTFAIVSSRSWRPSDAPLQKSLIVAGRGSSTRKLRGSSPQLNRHTARPRGSETTPTSSASLSKRAATPVGGSSLRSISMRVGGITVRSSPERIMPP